MSNLQTKKKLWIKLLQPYYAVKLDCETRRNLGALEKEYSGAGHSGTLNVTQKLIDMIAAAGGNFLAEQGFVPANNGQIRRGAGTGYIGWKDFGTHAAALRYLGRYFELGECLPDSLPAPQAQPKRAIAVSGRARQVATTSDSNTNSGSATKDLELLGFLNLAQWKVLDDKKLQDVGDDPATWKGLIAMKCALYAFCDRDEVLYIGKTARSVAKRFMGYRDPGKTQATNRKCHEHIRKLWKIKHTVRILVFPDTSLLQWSAFKINLAAGLEDALVAHFDPLLNGKMTTTMDDEQQVERGPI